MDCFGQLGLFDSSPVATPAPPATCLSFLEAWLPSAAAPGQTPADRERAVLAGLTRTLEAQLGSGAAERVARAVECARYDVWAPESCGAHALSWSRGGRGDQATARRSLPPSTGSFFFSAQASLHIAARFSSSAAQSCPPLARLILLVCCAGGSA